MLKVIRFLGAEQGCQGEKDSLGPRKRFPELPERSSLCSLKYLSGPF